MEIKEHKYKFSIPNVYKFEQFYTHECEMFYVQCLAAEVHLIFVYLFIDEPLEAIHLNNCKKVNQKKKKQTTAAIYS